MLTSNELEQNAARKILRFLRLKMQMRFVYRIRRAVESLREQRQEATAAEAEAAPPPPEPTIWIMLDGTASMGSALRTMAREIQRLLGLLPEGTTVGLVVYYDYDQKPPVTVVEPSALTSAFKRRLSDTLGGLRPSGGGDVPEAQRTALYHILEWARARQESGPVLIINIGDAMPHTLSGICRAEAARERQFFQRTAPEFLDIVPHLQQLADQDCRIVNLLTNNREGDPLNIAMAMLTDGLNFRINSQDQVASAMEQLIQGMFHENLPSNLRGMSLYGCDQQHPGSEKESLMLRSSLLSSAQAVAAVERLGSAFMRDGRSAKTLRRARTATSDELVKELKSFLAALKVWFSTLSSEQKRDLEKVQCIVTLETLQEAVIELSEIDTADLSLDELIPLVAKVMVGITYFYKPGSGFDGESAWQVRVWDACAAYTTSMSAILTGTADGTEFAGVYRDGRKCGVVPVAPNATVCELVTLARKHNVFQMLTSWAILKDVRPPPNATEAVSVSTLLKLLQRSEGGSESSLSAARDILRAVLASTPHAKQATLTDLRDKKIARAWSVHAPYAMDTPVAVVYAALVALSTNPELATEEFATQLAIELATLMANDRRRFNKEWIDALIPGVAAPSGVHPVETPHSLEQPAGEYPVGAQALHEIIDPVRRLIERLFLVLEIAPPTVDAERLVNAVLFTALNGRAARWNSQTGDATAVHAVGVQLHHHHQKVHENALADLCRLRTKFLRERMCTAIVAAAHTGDIANIRQIIKTGDCFEWQGENTKFSPTQTGDVLRALMSASLDKPVAQAVLYHCGLGFDPTTEAAASSAHGTQRCRELDVVHEFCSRFEIPEEEYLVNAGRSGVNRHGNSTHYPAMTSFTADNMGEAVRQIRETYDNPHRYIERCGRMLGRLLTLALADAEAIAAVGLLCEAIVRSGNRPRDLIRGRILWRIVGWPDERLSKKADGALLSEAEFKDLLRK